MHEVVRHTRPQVGPVGAPVMTVVLDGELTREDLAEVGHHLVRLAGRGCVDVVLDFEEVRHVDFRAIKPLLRKVEALRELGGDVRLASLSVYLHAIFRSVGAHDSFDFFAEADDARQSFSRGFHFLAQG